MQTEPIRLPAWIATLLVMLVIPVSVAWLTDVSVKTALATALGALAPLLIAGEIARRKVDCPLTVDTKLYESRRAAIELMKAPVTKKGRK